MVPVLFVLGCKEEDEGDDCPDFDHVGVGRLAVFDLEVFSCRFKKHGEFFQRHAVVDGLLAFVYGLSELIVRC